MSEISALVQQYELEFEDESRGARLANTWEVSSKRKHATRSRYTRRNTGAQGAHRRRQKHVCP